MEGSWRALQSAHRVHFLPATAAQRARDGLRMGKAVFVEQHELGHVKDKWQNHCTSRKGKILVKLRIVLADNILMASWTNTILAELPSPSAHPAAPGSPPLCVGGGMGCAGVWPQERCVGLRSTHVLLWSCVNTNVSLNSSTYSVWMCKCIYTSVPLQSHKGPCGRSCATAVRSAQPRGAPGVGICLWAVAAQPPLLRLTRAQWALLQSQAPPAGSIAPSRHISDAISGRVKCRISSFSSPYSCGLILNQQSL